MDLTNVYMLMLGRNNNTTALFHMHTANALGQTSNHIHICTLLTECWMHFARHKHTQVSLEYEYFEEIVKSPTLHRIAIAYTRK